MWAPTNRRLVVACVLVATLACVLVVVLFAPLHTPERAATTAPTGRAGHQAGTGVRVRVLPGVVVRGQTATIEVTGLSGTSPQVELVGATVNLGHALAWTPLRRVGPAWQASLPAPEFRGVYRIRLRTARGARAVTSEGWLLRVFARGTLGRPLLKTPEAVARSWVRGLSDTAALVGLRRWPLPAFDHRDPQLHQLLVIAYTLERHRGVPDPVGVFVTAVRESNRDRWRFLEATVSPQ